MQKIALVTGAYRGLGLETGKQLLSKGHLVIFTGRNLAKVNAAITDLGANARAQELDVNSTESVAAVKGWVEQGFGRLDILVNNAGMNYDTWHNAENANLDEVQQTIDTNLMGAWRMAQAFVPMMRKQGQGRIVNVSSGAGALNGMGGGTPGYSASKAAMNVLTIKLAADLAGTDILINSVCPGWVRTEMGGPSAPRSVEEGATGITWLAELPKKGPSGKFFRDQKEIDW